MNEWMLGLSIFLGLAFLAILIRIGFTPTKHIDAMGILSKTPAETASEMKAKEEPVRVEFKRDSR